MIQYQYYHRISKSKLFQMDWTVPNYIKCPVPVKEINYTIARDAPLNYNY
jgi:hypothetical protein